MVTFDWEETDSRKKTREFKKSGSIVWSVIEVTDACNFNCKWCYASSGSTPNHMSIGNFKCLVTRLSEAGLKQITLSGGEPTLYPHLKEAVKFSKDQGLIVHMNTNGYLLTKKLALELKKLGLSQVQTNIDSIDPRKHDEARGMKGSFHRALKALKNASEAGLTPVSQTVLAKYNEEEIFDIFKLGRSLGAKRCRTWDMMPVGFGKGKEDIRPISYIETLKKLDKFAYENGAIHIESGDPLFPGKRETNLEVSGGFCIATKGAYLPVSYSGDVFFCAAKRDSLYNIFTDMNGQDLEKFHRIRVNEYMEKKGFPSRCINCNLFENCKGACLVRREIPPKKIDYLCEVYN